jgi:AIPR protein
VSDDLLAFAADIRQEVLLRADLEDEESLRPEAFTEILLEHLEEAGEIDEGHASYHRDRGIEVSGYGVNDEGDVLNLFITIYRGDVPPTTVGNQDIEVSFRRLLTFWNRTADAYHKTLEDSSEAFDMAMRLHEIHGSVAQLRLFLLTDGLARSEYRPAEDTDGVETSFHIWDIRRLHRLVTSGQRREPIEIDFVGRFGAAIPCLPTVSDDCDYQAYLAIVPGEVLNEIYAQYGPRLLELNVRSYLQARGKVNQGIRRTILDQPGRFLAYNNGISCTASEVSLVDLPGGGRGIRRIKNLQIVNGGQTTASIHHAVRRDHADASAIQIPAKLTVIAEGSLEEIVPLISRYANSQNKISEADFSANDPFHVRVEELSRTTWAPATDGTMRQTRWFYERARGQYADALGRAGTAAQQRKFKQEHPPAQRFTKTDLAKFENTWDQLPHIVSRGAQKNFAEFTLRLATRHRGEPDATYLRHLIAKAILFRRAERLVSAQKFGGYRANIVTYTLAYLSNATAQRVNLDRIWDQQDIGEALQESIIDISHAVYRTLTSPPGGANITEWAKREACWQRIRALDIKLPSALDDELLPLHARQTATAVTGIEAPDEAERRVIEKISKIPPETWLALSHWAKETNNLQGWQRGIAYDLGRRARQGREPSRKQAAQAEIILDEAERLGFRAPSDPNG